MSECVTPRATMADVGYRAGVSRMTVSRVLSEPWLVSPETQQRVRDAIEELRFRPNAVARTLASRSSNTLGVVSTGIALHSFSKRMIAFDEAARAAGYQVSLANLSTTETSLSPSADQGGLVAAIEAFLDQHVIAIVLIAADVGSIDLVRSMDVPVPVIFAESSGLSGPGNVAVDQVEAGRIATRHLAQLGHRRVAHVAGPKWSLNAIARCEGWRSESERLGLELGDLIVGDWTAAAGYEAAKEIVRRGATTAIYVASDTVALGVLRGLADAGLRVPDDVSVVGHNDEPNAAYFTPPLTTIHEDLEALGELLVATVERRLAGEETFDVPLVQSELVVRKSTAARREEIPVADVS